MAKRKRGRPRRKPPQRCPKCGKIGNIIRETQHRLYKNTGKAYSYTYTYFTHYVKGKSTKDDQGQHMRRCYVPKKKAQTLRVDGGES